MGGFAWTLCQGGAKCCDLWEARQEFRDKVPGVPLACFLSRSSNMVSRWYKCDAEFDTWLSNSFFGQTRNMIIFAFICFLFNMTSERHIWQIFHMNMPVRKSTLGTRQVSWSENKLSAVDIAGTSHSFYFSRAAIHPYLLFRLFQASPPSAAIYVWRLTFYGSSNLPFFTNLVADFPKFRRLNAKKFCRWQNLCSQRPKLSAFSHQICGEKSIFHPP